MARVSAVLSVGLGVMLVFGLTASASAEPAEETPTFSKDVAPILFENCVQCHRPNHIAPMSLMTYADARPWARAVKQRVAAREMPPWGAAPGIQEYSNDTSLTQEEIDTIVAWVDGGVPRGDDTDLPAAPEFADGWSIGEPDLIFKMVEPIDIPADGTIPYLYVTVPTNLTEDIWISASEFKPTDRRTVHHVISTVVEGNGQPVDPKPKLRRESDRTRVPGARIGGFLPNRTGTVYPEGVASRIPAGADIVLQMHYTTIGEALQDQSEIAVILAKQPEPGSGPRLRRTGGGTVPNMTFVIPPGAPSHEVRATRTIEDDTYLINMMPHMHVRGKDAKYTVIYPDGRKEVALWVPNYDFNWQLRYQLAEPIFMPKGSTLEVVVHYDNSPNNRYNPDPSAEVRWGEQTWEEMMLGYYGTVEAPKPPTEEQQQ